MEVKTSMETMDSKAFPRSSAQGVRKMIACNRIWCSKASGIDLEVVD